MTRLKLNKATIFFAVIVALITVYSCSTKKNSFTRRVYHNLTGHYNMFWNGRESYREGVAILEKSVKDNYNKTLLIYNYGTEAEAQALNPYMDKAIEKSSLNIQRHSMFFKHKEYVRWIDDSYLLIGLGYFYKQEYQKARRTFEFVINEYKDNDIKYEAMLWLGNTYNQLKKFKRARSVLDNLQNEIDKNPEVPKNVIKYLPLVRADMYLLQEKYSQAKEPLVDALYLRQKKNMDARARFILGQIYQYEEELYLASKYYKQVIKKNPPYEMAFNASINLARCYDIRYGENSKGIIKNLEKMLKEDKNKEFLDQIYYALADVAFKDGIDTLAINYLRLSVATSVSNNYQKATSSLKLGDIYFNVPNYELAQAYYDTAVQVLPEDYPDYEKIEARTAYLTELVQNLIIIQVEDSMQMLAAISEEERYAIIDKIIEDLIEEEEKQKELEDQMAAMSQNLGMPGGMPGGPTMGGPTGVGAWYFYNPAALSFGFSDFKKKWGNRKLEDNWRLSTKQAIYEPEEEEFLVQADSITSDSSVIISNDTHSRDYYLQNIPFTEEQIAVSDSLIQEALYNLGFIYKDKLDDYPKSIESFETLLERYPGNKYLLQTYYQLFRLYTRQENFDKTEYYKNLIIDQFPESDYAKLLLDPDYYKELEARKNLAVNLYNETYEHYEEGHYYTVFTNSNRALSEFEEPREILAKFEYLRALSLGKIEVVDSLQVALENLVAKYPDSEVTPLAQNILDYLKGPADTSAVASQKEEEIIDVSIYEFKPYSKQIFALVVSGAHVNINALKVRISDFNSKYYSLDNLSITNILLDASTHFVMVGNYKTIDRAMNYYNAIMSNDYVFSNLETDDYDGFVIAQENYPVFYKDKDVKKYLAFFMQNYFEEQ
ncbi:MAG: tetratricopeptide repeat protein [Bacteroidales bacterium]|nr:tetratricopeptide repeat protein [Bacteroidales bacterium]